MRWVVFVTFQHLFLCDVSAVAVWFYLGTAMEASAEVPIHRAAGGGGRSSGGTKQRCSGVTDHRTRGSATVRIVLKKCSVFNYYIFE